MGFQAIGRGARRTSAGIEVNVEIQDSTTMRQLKFQTYTGKTLVAIQKQIQADVDALAANEQDATLSQAVVGQLLAVSEAPIDAVIEPVAQGTAADAEG